MLPPTFKTARYLITAYRPEDESRYLEMALDAEVIKFMGGVDGNVQEEKERFQKIFRIYSSNDKRWFWIWGVYQDGKLCAHIELKDSEHTTSEELEIVYMVHPGERRKGLMVEVFTVLKEHQRQWGRTVIATVNGDNRASTALLEKWGVEKTMLHTDEQTGEQYYKYFLQGGR